MKIFYACILLLAALHLKAAPPTQAATNLGFYAIDGGYFNIGWTPGNGARRIIVCKAGSAVTFTPQNGSSYTANTNFGDGQQVAPGEYIVYNNAFTSFYLTGLTAATTYYFAVFEYNGTGIATEYLTQPYLSGSAATPAAPTVQASAINFSNITATTVTINWTNGNGTRRLVLAKEAAIVNANPVNNTAYAGNSAFGNGASMGNGNYAIHSSSGNSVMVTNLKAGTVYHFAIYEYNGNAQPQYMLPAATASVTTRTVPTIAATNVQVTKADGKEISLAWTNGNGQRRIIIAKKGSDVTAVPANNTVYTANSEFGAGQQLAVGEYVVFNDNFNAATITGLEPGTAYFFKIFEYDGGAGTALYLTSTWGTVNGITANTPTAQASNITAANINANAMSLLFTKGNGRARLIVARKNEPVNAVPQNFTVYNSSDFGEGVDLGDGNFVVGNTTGTISSINKLEPNTTYHFAVFDYNGYNQPLYLTPAATFSAATTAPLPVKLSHFTATVQLQKVVLQWATSFESNSSHFIIESSADGEHFNQRQSVAATGYSSTTKQYTATDATALSGKVFYRLKCVDKDGSFEYSKVIVVTMQTQTAILRSNLVQHRLDITGAEAVQQWQVINNSGQVLKKGGSNSNYISIDVAKLSAGQYWVILYKPGSIERLAFVKN
jgi:hypothetical protein